MGGLKGEEGGGRREAGGGRREGYVSWGCCFAEWCFIPFSDLI